MSAFHWDRLAGLAALVLFTGCREPAANFVVAPDGSDAHPGTAAQPFATFARARDAVRHLQTSSPPRDIVVLFRGGTYPLDAPLVLEPQDSGRAGCRVTYAAWPGETPVFSGATEIRGFVPRADGAWEVRVPAGMRFEHLFVNGRRAARARHPGAGAFTLLEVREEPRAGGRTRQGLSTVTFRMDPAHLRPFAGLDADAVQQVQVVVHHKWDHTRRFIRSVDVAQGLIVTQGEPMKPWNPMAQGNLVYFENLPGACDEPGEWFLDASGVLVYRPLPGEAVATAVARAPQVERLLELRGDPATGRCVENVTFAGLSFQHADYRTPPGGFEPMQAAAGIGAAIQADGIRGIILTNCTVRHTGAHGLWFRRGCQDSRIEHCRIADLGGGAIRIGDTRVPATAAEQTWGITADNNLLHHGGRHFPCACGVWIGHSGTNTVTHNDIGDFFYTGISVGWVWGYGDSFAKANDIGFNHVHHLGQGWLSDMGGIYTLGRSEGTRVHDNWFHHIWAHGYGGWGLYTDEGSTGIVFENNLVHDTKDGSFHQHYGRENVVRNNVLAFSRQCQVRATRAEEHVSFTFERNVIVWETGSALQGPWDKLQYVSRSNLWWRMDGAAPEFAGRTLEAWQAAGHEAGSRAADPRFADAARRDFRLAAESPAHALGFVPFEVKAGVYGDPAWIEAARAAPMPDFDHLPAWSK